jgi:hypothetical protein
MCCASPDRRGGGDGKNFRASNASRTPLHVLRTALLVGLFPVLPAGAVVAQRTMVCTDGTTHEGSFDDMVSIMASRASLASGACLIEWPAPSPEIHAGSGKQSHASSFDGMGNASSHSATGCLGWRAHCKELLG